MVDAVSSNTAHVTGPNSLQRTTSLSTTQKTSQAVTQTILDQGLEAVRNAKKVGKSGKAGGAGSVGFSRNLPRGSLVDILT